MPSIPIWSVVILIASAIFIIGCLLIRLIRCRKSVLSTVDPTEYSDKKHGTYTFDNKTVSLMDLSASPSNIQSPIPSTIKSLSSHLHLPVDLSASTANHAGKQPQECSRASQHHHIDHMQIQLSSPSPDTSFVFKDMESGTADANRTDALCRSSSTDSSDILNQHDVVPTDLPNTNNITFTINNAFSYPKSRQKSLVMKRNVRQLFELSTGQSGDSDTHNASSAASLSSLPPPVPPKDDAPLSPTRFSIPSAPLPTKMEKDINDLATNNKDEPKPVKPTMLFHQWKDEANKEDPVTHLSLSLPGISTNTSINMESETRQLIAHDLDSMFAWSPVGDTDDASDHHSIHSILQNDTNADIQSVTSGSVHRLVRNSTVSNTDRRSLAAPSIVSSIRPSLHDMASWWPIQDTVPDQALTTEANTLDPTRLLPHVEISVQDPLHALIQSSVVASKSMMSSCPPPRSTYSRTTLNNLRRALTKENQNLEIEIESEPEQMEQELQASYQLPATELQHATVPDNEHSPSAIQDFCDEESTPSASPPPSPIYCHNTERYSSTITAKPSSAETAVPSQGHSKIAQAWEIASVSATPQPTNGSPRSSRVEDSYSSRTNSVCRKPQSPRNTHRLSNQSSTANSSTRSNPSQTVSPPRSANPRQLNQYLMSMSLQAHGRSRHRPGLPNGFNNEDWSVQDSHNEGEGEGPQPTVSFSSSTVRTMIPENEPIGPHTGKKTILTSNQQKQDAYHQLQYHVQPVRSEQNHPHKKTTPTDQDEESQQHQLDGTLRRNKQQRQSIPWSSSNFTEVKTHDKTPAERERDRYLQSLK